MDTLMEMIPKPDYLQQGDVLIKPMPLPKEG